MAEPIEVLQDQSQDLLAELLVPAAVSDDVRDRLALVAIVQYLSVEVDVEIGLSFQQSLLSLCLQVGFLADQEADHFERAGDAVDSDVRAHVVRIGG